MNAIRTLDRIPSPSMTNLRGISHNKNKPICFGYLFIDYLMLTKWLKRTSIFRARNAQRIGQTVVLRLYATERVKTKLSFKLSCHHNLDQ